MFCLDEIIEATQSSPRVVSEVHDVNSINWVNGLSDPGEMIACGYLPELRRRAGEQDEAYADRIRPIVMALPAEQRNQIMGAAIRRASLDTSNGRVNVMVAGKLPWHGLGVNVDKATNSEQAIRLSGLDWQVQKMPLSYNVNGNDVTLKDTFAIARNDTWAPLGTVGARYQPIQNTEAFAFLDGVLQEYGARYESAGSLYGGEKVWMLAHLPQQAFTINGGDRQEPYVIFENCHDGSGAAWCYPTSVRVVCANTFRTSTKERGKGLSIRHTGNVQDKIKTAQAALGMAVESFEEYRTAAEAMYARPLDIKHYAHDVLDAVLEVTQADALKGADALAAALQVTEAQRELAEKSFERKIEKREEILEEILSRYESDTCGVGSIRGTAWSCFNAITEMADHAKLGKNSRDEETRLSRRFESVLSGDMDNLKQVAFAKAMA